MQRTTSVAGLRRKIMWLRWLLPIFILLLVLVEQYLAHVRFGHVHNWAHFFSQVLIYGIGAALLAWLAMTYLGRGAAETDAAQLAVENTHRQLADANRRLQFLIDVSRRLSMATDEESVVDAILELPGEVLPTVGCSLIRHDEKGEPAQVSHSGHLKTEQFDRWCAHLSVDVEEERCLHCQAPQHSRTVACPLSETEGMGSVCSVLRLPLLDDVRVSGLLILYMPTAGELSERQEQLLTALTAEIALALESRRLRARELATFGYLQEARLFADFDARLAAVLTHAVEMFETDGGVLLRAEEHGNQLVVEAQAGPSLGAALPLLLGLALSAREGSTPLVIGDLQQEEASQAGVRAVLIAPLRNDEGLLGMLAFWSSHERGFRDHHVRLAAMLAGQLSLLLDNYRLYLQVESQAVLAERARLSRELHDGLAQVLGYLKLLLARSELWLREGDRTRALDGLAKANHLVADAYVDTREAIDALRVRADGGMIVSWLDQLLSDFEVLSGISASTSSLPQVDLPVEVQVQLIRIIQEALSNVRKHADADRARVEWQRLPQGLLLEIVDNGRGFDALDAPPLAQHGLKIMRERAEILDATFQVTGDPGLGTRVSILIPKRWLSEKEGHYAITD